MFYTIPIWIKDTFESCCFFKGFSSEFERVKNLPCGETQTFTVKFVPQRANMKMGHISVVMPIQVHMDAYKHVVIIFDSVKHLSGPCLPPWSVKSWPWFCLILQVTCGPTVHVQLCAVVTEPAISISADTLQFDTVQCDMCQVIQRDDED